MFEIESKSPEQVTIITKQTSVTFDVEAAEISGKIAVGAFPKILFAHSVA